MTFNDWKQQAVGRHIDVDGAYGAQCVDVYLDYIVKVIGVNEWASVSGWGDAAQLYPKANQNYLTKFDSSGIPQKGDVIFYGPTRTNSAGHVAIVDSADASGVTCIEQDGFNPSGSCYVKFRPWNGTCLGWQRPKNLVIASTPQGGEMANRDQVNALYKGILFRDGDPGGLSAYTGKDANFIANEFLNSPERKSLEASIVQTRAAVTSMQATIDSLKDNPTKADYAAVQASLNDKLAELQAAQDALEAEKKNIKQIPVYTVDETTRANSAETLTLVKSIKGMLVNFIGFVKTKLGK